MSNRSPEVYEQPSLSEFLSGQYRIEKQPVQEKPRVRDVEAQTTVAAVAETGTNAREVFHKSSSIALEARDDPFAPREGKTLTWQNVNMVLVSWFFKIPWIRRIV